MPRWPNCRSSPSFVIECTRVHNRRRAGERMASSLWHVTLHNHTRPRPMHARARLTRIRELRGDDD